MAQQSIAGFNSGRETARRKPLRTRASAGVADWRAANQDQENRERDEAAIQAQHMRPPHSIAHRTGKAFQIHPLEIFGTQFFRIEIKLYLLDRSSEILR